MNMDVWFCKSPLYLQSSDQRPLFSIFFFFFFSRILVSKEYEREKRLRARRQRRIQMGLEEDPNKTNAENISM